MFNMLPLYIKNTQGDAHIRSPAMVPTIGLFFLSTSVMELEVSVLIIPPFLNLHILECTENTYIYSFVKSQFYFQLPHSTFDIM